MVWVEGTDAGYFLNLESGTYLFVSAGPGGTWVVGMAFSGGSKQLKGSWPTQADAEEAARKLVDSIDPSTY